MRSHDARMSIDQDILDAARAALLKRLRGDAYESYSTSQMRFVGMPLGELEALIGRYEARIGQASSGGGFVSVEGVQ